MTFRDLRTCLRLPLLINIGGDSAQFLPTTPPPHNPPLPVLGCDVLALCPRLRAAGAGGELHPADPRALPRGERGRHRGVGLPAPGGGRDARDRC